MSLLQQQVAYYRARAGEYDEWWFRAGRYDRGPDFNAQWHAETAAVEAALASWLAATQPRSVLELACGTGLFTRLIAPRVARLTAIDASTEVIENVARGHHCDDKSGRIAWPSLRATPVFGRWRRPPRSGVLGHRTVVGACIQPRDGCVNVSTARSAQVLRGAWLPAPARRARGNRNAQPRSHCNAY